MAFAWLNFLGMAVLGGIVLTEPEEKNLHAIFIGVSEYDNHALDLRGTVRDAERLSEAMINARGSLLSRDRTIHLKGRVAGSDIRQALEAAVQRMKSGDTLLFYYGGHSAMIPDTNNTERFVLASSETILPGRREGNYSGLFDLFEELRRLSNHLSGCDLVLIIDGCNTPASRFAEIQIPGASLTAFVATRSHASAREMLIKTGEDAGTYRGVFTLALENVIRRQEGDVNLDGLLSFDELYLRTYPECVKLCLKNEFSVQYPSLAGDRSNAQFLCKAPGLKREIRLEKGKPLPVALSRHDTVKINGRLYKISEVQKPDDEKGGKVTLSAEDDGTLSDGFVVFSDEKEEKKEIFWLDAGTLRQIESLPDPTKSVAVVISLGPIYGSIKDYGTPLANVPRVAEDLDAALTKLGFGKIKHFCESDATSKAVNDYFKDEFFGGDEIDRLLVVFMGHGKHYENGNSYFITADYRGEAQIGASTITDSDILKILKDAKSKHTMVIIDACESGTADFGMRGGQAAALTAEDSTATKAVLHWKDEPSRCLLTGTYRVQAGNVEDGAGLFARELVSSLQGPADENGDRVITATELYQYCSRSVQRRLKEKESKGEAIEKQNVSVVWYSPGDEFVSRSAILPKLPVGQMFFVLPIVTY